MTTDTCLHSPTAPLATQNSTTSDRWSECGVDNHDDDGENRDGDENWYQYRTQEFCGNAAYSLYGVKKGHFVVNTCSRGTYINSFFTYGGSDVLAEALGISVKQYYYDDDSYSNADCLLLENEGNDDSYISSTLGCSADGNFAMANFQGQTCDGKYFLETVDNLRSYNRAIKVNCKGIWALNKHKSSSSASPAETLLRSSWACDIDMYPNGCPDPYGMKRKYTTVLRAASNGQPTGIAVANAQLKNPLRVASFLAFVAGVGLLSYSFYTKNKDKIQENGGGFVGVVTTMRQNIAKRSKSKKKHRSRSHKKSRRRQQQEEELQPSQQGVYA